MKIKNISSIKKELYEPYFKITNEVETDLNGNIEIIIVDERNMEKEIQKIFPYETITKSDGCTVEGKTLFKGDNNYVFLNAKLFKYIRNTKTQFDIMPLFTIFHELGHVKSYQEYGHLIYNNNARSYPEKLNVMWKICRDEAIAERNSAKIYRIKDIFDIQLSEFNDITERENLLHYYKPLVSNNPQTETMAQLHDYYFNPIFKKCGLILGLSEFIDLNTLKISDIFYNIIDCNISGNEDVPIKFNDIVIKIFDILPKRV